MLMALMLGIILMALGFYWMKKIYHKNRKEFNIEGRKKLSSFLTLTAFLMDIMAPRTIENLSGVLVMLGFCFTVVGLWGIWGLIHHVLRF